LVDGLKALDPKRPIREADIGRVGSHVGNGPTGDIRSPGAIRKPTPQLERLDRDRR